MMSPLVIITVASAIIGMSLYMSLVWWLRGGIYIVVDGFFAGLLCGWAGYKAAGWLGLGATAAGAGS